MIIFEATNAGDCGSVTAYAVAFDKEIAVELIRYSWNATGIKGFRSETAARAALAANIAGEDGTIPNHFEIRGYVESVSDPDQGPHFRLISAFPVGG